jgi:DNA-binding HxlR family transcriptional regulator
VDIMQAFSTARRGARPKRSTCPVSRTLDVLGDRWSLLVVRDLIRGKRRFAEFLESKEGIPTNTLAERLKRLVRAGIIESRRYSEHPPRVEYLLTAKGEELRPIIRAMVEWGVKHAGGRLPLPVPARH